MVRAYDDNGNVVDLVKWEEEIRAEERAKTIGNVMFAFKNYQNMNNPQNAHIFWEMLVKEQTN